jgi:hypothetical protein
MTQRFLSKKIECRYRYCFDVRHNYKRSTRAKGVVRFLGRLRIPTRAWLPRRTELPSAKSTVRSRFLLFYASTPDGFGKDKRG